MKQVLVRKGHIIVENVPPPLVDKGSVLVEVKYSLISAGTESAGVAASGESLLQKALKQPEKVKQVLNMVKTQGLSETIDKVKGKLESANPTGYSCAGVVIDVGENIRDIKMGDRVACGGTGYANHAEIVCVPHNLVVKIPDGLDFKQAASVMLGAIAMQGVRRAIPTFGETVAVIGLGLVGQLTAQILKVAGCHVIGMDLIEPRVAFAQNLGMDWGVILALERSEGIGKIDPVEQVMRYTSGMGADATIITAATQSDLPVQQAMEMTRKKGKVVVVGDVGLHLQRQPFYEKEIDFLISCSYGPGRYDETYEEKGIDYPYAYVRWTENRNMQEYLRMLAGTEPPPLRKVNFKALISKEYDIADAPEAYRELKESQDRPLGVLLRYGSEDTSAESGSLSAERKILVNPKPIKKEGSRSNPENRGIINVAVIGAGSFAQSVHLPNLRKLSDLYNIYAIVTRTGNNAKQVAKRFGANYCTTDYQEILQDENVDMVLITTRHNLHAKMAMEAAQAGKAILLEKPMALNQEELDELVKVLQETQVPFMVGFNRRFSPFAVRAKEIISQRQNPLIINYRVNAGYIPLDHWVHTEEGGGRIIGEACHMFDLFNYLVNSQVEHPVHGVDRSRFIGSEEINVNAIKPQTSQVSSQDNFTATLQYADGSVCTLTYTALGAKEFGKEYIEIHTDGQTLIIDDFKSLEVFGGKAKGFKSRSVQKGHLEELRLFAQCSKGETDLPIPLEQLVSATKTSFVVDLEVRSLKEHRYEL